MSQVTISKKEYRQLKIESQAYKRKASKFFNFFVKSSVEEIVEDFQKTGLYTKGFLKDLEQGLRKSSFAK